MTQPDRSLRPETLDDFIGQQRLVGHLRVRIRSALGAVRPMDHALFVAPPGAGKTSLATVIAAELGEHMVAVARPIGARELLDVLYELGQGVLFLDEIHRFSTAQQENLLPLLEGGYLEAKWGREHFEWLTVLAATTEPQGVIAPLRDRFPIRPDTGSEFDPYTDVEMAEIVAVMGSRVGITLAPDDVMALGTAAGGTPRNARSLILAARDLTASQGGEPPTAAEVLEFCQVDSDGLTRAHNTYLRRLYEMGGQAGLDPISTRLRLHPSAVRDIERLLLDRQLIGLEPRGRVLTRAGRDRIGVTPQRRKAS